MRTDDVDTAHDAAIESDFDWEVANEIGALTRMYGGQRVDLAPTLARAAFWMRVYNEITGGDLIAAAAVGMLSHRLKIGFIDMRKAN